MGKAIAHPRTSVQTSLKYCAHTLSGGAQLDAIRDLEMLSSSPMFLIPLYLHMTATVAATASPSTQTTKAYDHNAAPRVLCCLTAVVYHYLRANYEGLGASDPTAG